MPLSSEPVELIVEASEAGCRLDAFLAARLPDYSRVLMRRVIMAGGVRVDDGGGKPAYRLKPNQVVTVRLPAIPRQSPRPEDIPLEILFEEDDVVVVNKPPDMVVHPARGHWAGTLAGALQFRYGQSLSVAGGLNRPSIVHRLDRDTSGAILVARNDIAHAKLSKQFADRSIQKEYFALVVGSPPCDRDIIDCPIGFHPHVREKMAIRHEGGETRPAQTFYETLERFQGFSAVSAQPKTGRTHQIRVHLNHLGCPVLCDRQYGGRHQITRGEIRREPADELVLLERQALHAWRLRFLHPSTDAPIEVEAPLPADIVTVLEELRTYRAVSGKRL